MVVIWGPKNDFLYPAVTVNPLVILTLVTLGQILMCLIFLQTTLSLL